MNPEKKRRFLQKRQQRVLQNLRKEWEYSLPTIAGVLVVVLFHNLASIFIAGFLSGFTGVIIMRKREMASAYVVMRGTPAFVVGCIYTCLAWGLTLAGLVAYMLGK